VSPGSSRRRGYTDIRGQGTYQRSAAADRARQVVARGGTRPETRGSAVAAGGSWRLAAARGFLARAVGPLVPTVLTRSAGSIRSARMPSLVHQYRHWRQPTHANAGQRRAIFRCAAAAADHIPETSDRKWAARTRSACQGAVCLRPQQHAAVGLRDRPRIARHASTRKKPALEIRTPRVVGRNHLTKRLRPSRCMRALDAAAPSAQPAPGWLRA
jgi:hypothetical protein